MTAALARAGLAAAGIKVNGAGDIRVSAGGRDLYLVPQAPGSRRWAASWTEGGVLRVVDDLDVDGMAREVAGRWLAGDRLN